MTVDTPQSDTFIQDIETGAAEGLGLAIGGLFFGLLVLVIGGKKFVKQIKSMGV